PAWGGLNGRGRVQPRRPPITGTGESPCAPLSHTASWRSSSSLRSSISRARRSSTAGVAGGGADGGWRAQPARINASTRAGKGSLTPPIVPTILRRSSTHLARVTGPVFRSQHLLVDLADGGERQAVDELPRLGRVGAALAILDELHQRFGFRSLALLGDDQRRHRLAPLLVRHADHRHHGDVGMGGDHVLDFTREDVEAAGYDHVLLAIDDVE